LNSLHLKSFTRCKRKAWLDFEGKKSYEVWSSHKAIDKINQFQIFSEFCNGEIYTGLKACQNGYQGVIGLKIKGNLFQNINAEILPQLLLKTKGKSKWGQYKYLPAVYKLGHKTTKEHLFDLAFSSMLLEPFQESKIEKGLVISTFCKKVKVEEIYLNKKLRKKVLIDHGFRLPSAADNRPLKCEEFWEKSKQTLFISATPGQWELDQCDGEFIEQVIRPTGVLDPVIDVRPSEGQIEDLLSEIRIRAEKNQRVLVTTLTKRMAEDLTDFLSENKVRVRYLHSEIHSIERIEIIQDLRMGEYDVLVGVNLLREGLDLPEVSLVAILDADKEGFLRAERSLIQTIGRAARHVEGVALLYADNFTDSMKRAISETERRRIIQKKYNQVNGITPKPAGKKIENSILSFLELSRKLDSGGLSKDLINIVNNKTDAILNSSDHQCLLEELPDLIDKLEIKMKDAAKELNFEEAANLRDRIKKLRQKLARNN